MNKPYNIQSIERTLRIIEIIAEREEITIGELSLLADLPKSTTHRILSILRNNGYVEKNENDQFYLSLKILELASTIRRRLRITQIALPYLRDLCEKVNENVYMGVLSQRKVVYIEKINSSQPLQLVLSIGSTGELHCTGIGKVLLAHLPAEERQDIYKEKLNKLTKYTITDPDLLEEHLKEVLTQGYAIDNEEANPGICSIAAPIYSYKGVVKYGISMALPSIFFSPEKVNHLISLLKETAAEISRAMGKI